jgi:FkbM family methyltransferase
MTNSNQSISSSSDSKSSETIQTSTEVKKILVVGATGLIGSSLLSFLKRRGHNAYGTSRNRNIEKSDLLYLNLESTQHDINFSEYDTVIICAAVAKLEECENKPEHCELVNVTNTISLINQCADGESFVIFISSNAVFDGEKEFYDHNDNPNPITKYGETKLSVEKHIKALNSKSVCVLRLTKVISNNEEFIKNWKREARLLEGGIKAFSNRFLSPLTLNEVNAALELLSERKMPGVFQLGGCEEISYWEFAKKLFKEDQSIQGKIIKTIDRDSKKAIHNSLKTHLPVDRKSYSASGADCIVQSILRDVKSGTYIDIGANHPKLDNNTYYFYEKGWSGLAVDPNMDFDVMWKHERPLDKFEPVVVSLEEGVFNYYKFPDSTLNGIDETQMTRYSKRFPIEEIVVEKRLGKTLDNLRSLYLAKKEIHFLSIDVEGAELDILSGANLRAWKPGVILIETKNMSLYNVSDNKIVDYLTSLGYRLISKTLLDAIFVLPQKDYLKWIPKTIL